jgi:hypothetical protein
MFRLEKFRHERTAVPKTPGRLERPLRLTQRNYIHGEELRPRQSVFVEDSGRQLIWDSNFRLRNSDHGLNFAQFTNKEKLYERCDSLK